MEIQRLQEAVAAVCPIYGVRNRSGVLSFDATLVATVDQIAAAQSVVNAFDQSEAAEVSWLLNKAKRQAVADIDLPDDGGIKLRAMVAVLVDEINALRDWITSFKAATAAATNLANLQTRVAALAATPDRTLTQARQAIAAKIQAGTVDS